MPYLLRCLLALPLLAAASVAVADNADRDPWAGFNRKVFGFNDRLDRWVGKPLAVGYQAIIPDGIDTHITYFFRNLDDVANAANLALQGQGHQALDVSMRVVANSTVGLGGLIDVASAGGIPRRESSFGTTLGKWGLGSGHYLVLPFLGPSTLRDAAGVPVDWIFNPLLMPVTLVPDETGRFALEGLWMTDKRADLLHYEEAVVGDRYVFIRDIYLQHRDFDINGAQAVDPFLDEDAPEE